MTSSTAVLLALLLLPVEGGASPRATDAPVARARLDLRAASDCISRDGFVARVAARSPRIQFVEDATAVAVEATFAATRLGGVSAELVLAGNLAKQSPRRLLAPTCVEAADAVALMVAVALDPDWVGEHPATAAGETAPTDAKDPLPDALTGKGATSAPASYTSQTSLSEPDRKLAALQPSASATPRSTPDAASPGTPPAPTRRYAGAHVGGQMVWGPAPAVMFGVALYGMAALDRDALWSPAVAVGVYHAWRSDLAEPGGTASFTLDAASLDACAVRMRLSLVDTRACASVLLGRLSARGSETLAPAEGTAAFGAAGAALLMTARLTSLVELSARFGSGMTFRRDSFEFASTVFHRASRFTTSASIGVGLRLP